MSGRAGVQQELGFCRSPDGTRIAYAISGSGPPLLVTKAWISSLQYDLHGPMWPHFVAALGTFVTLIRYDERGFGLSDWNPVDVSLEARVSDLEAVANAAGLGRFALMCTSQGGPVAITYAVDHPERVTRLLLYDAHATPTRSDDDDTVFDTYIQLVRAGWNRPSSSFRHVMSENLLPSGTEAQKRWIDELLPRCTSAETAIRTGLARRTTDVTDLLSRVAAPTLVLHSRGDRMNEFAEGRRLAAHIPEARFHPMESENHLLLADDPEWPGFVAAVQDFMRPDLGAVTGARPALEQLTTRENEVLRLAAAGRSNEDIACELHLSTRTVERHLSNCYRKLGVSGRSARAAAVAHILSS